MSIKYGHRWFAEIKRIRAVRSAAEQHPGIQLRGEDVSGLGAVVEEAEGEASTISDFKSMELKLPDV